MEFKILEQEMTYTGKELRSGWVSAQTGLDGDAAVGFVGPCRVENEDLVDLDDARAGEYIESASMAHVLVEHPDCSLRIAVLRQRLLVSILCDIMREKGCDVKRVGDDVYALRRKLTVSIAAPAPSSSLIHLGINVRPDGAPVPAIGLEELGLDARETLAQILRGYRNELRTCAHAEKKVRTVS